LNSITTASNGINILNNIIANNGNITCPGKGTFIEISTTSISHISGTSINSVLIKDGNIIMTYPTAKIQVKNIELTSGLNGDSFVGIKIRESGRGEA
jgi:hypothetical protein